MSHYYLVQFFLDFLVDTNTNKYQILLILIHIRYTGSIVNLEPVTIRLKFESLVSTSNPSMVDEYFFRMSGAFNHNFRRFCLKKRRVYFKYERVCCIQKFITTTPKISPIYFWRVFSPLTGGLRTFWYFHDMIHTLFINSEYQFRKHMIKQPQTKNNEENIVTADDLSDVTAVPGFGSNPFVRSTA